MNQTRNSGGIKAVLESRKNLVETHAKTIGSQVHMWLEDSYENFKSQSWVGAEAMRKTQ